MFFLKRFKTHADYEKFCQGYKGEVYFPLTAKCDDEGYFDAHYIQDGPRWMDDMIWDSGATWIVTYGNDVEAAYKNDR